MTRRNWRVQPPVGCPQCHSLVWDRREWAADLFTQGLSWVCLGCGYERWETLDDQGHRRSGERWAVCKCCGRVLQSGEAAMNGYGVLCGRGQCHCHERAVVRDQRRLKHLRRVVQRDG
ncbi:hypothetical protein [Sulfobacillus harzensis]|uniref:Uncharacterized protein n=1 Tax=Sulfobacillus harzensis TaxID=2729629 RepID=A0A7Y0L4X0_9FIRM|nr:hypothetical protein [Sulfobacillus harzensis]NMP23143.1 hypothetical protein [Sulfobacillus harzensis]